MYDHPTPRGETAPDSETFPRLERHGGDFPYYRGTPCNLTLLQWALVLAAVAFAYFALVTLLPRFRTGPAALLPALAFVGIPLLTLALVAGRHWTALFRRPVAADLPVIAGVLLLNIAATLGLGFLAVTFFDAQVNPAGQQLAQSSGGAVVIFFLRTGLQLFGEEVFTVLPFLALLTAACAAGMRRRAAILTAMLIVSVVFALAHLPTYGWNWAQTLVALVPVRLVLLLPYLMTKNILVSTVVHVLNDWLLFGLPLLAAGLAGAGGP